MGELEDLYLTLRAPMQKWAQDLNQGRSAAAQFEQQTAAQFKQVGQDASKAFDGAGQAATKTFDGIKRDANGKLRDASGRFVQIGSDAEKAFLAAEKASDRAGQHFAGLRGVADKVRDGFDGLKQKLHLTGDEGEKAAETTSSAWGKVVGVVAGLGVTAAATSFFHSAIAEARDAVKVGADTANSLKVTGASAWISAKQVGDLADSLSNYAGIDDDVVQSGENLLLTFKNVRNAAGDGNAVFDRASKAAVDLSAKFGNDLSSASIQVGKALDNPVKGVSALTRVGVTFTQQQKDMIEQMVKSGDTLGAQRLILGELESQVSGTAGAMADPWQRLMVVWKNVEERVGVFLLPILNKVIDWGLVLLPTAVNAASKAFAFIAGGIKDFLAGFKHGTDALGSPTSWWAAWGATALGWALKVKGGISDFLSGFRKGTDELGSAQSRWAQWGAVIHFHVLQVKQAITEFVAGFKGATGGLRGYQSQWMQWGISAHSAFDRAKRAASEAWAVIGPVFHEIGDYIRTHLQPILISIGAAFAVLGTGGIISIVAGAIGSLIGVIAGLVAALVSPVIIIGALVAGLVYAYQESDRFRAVVLALKDAAVVAFGWLRENVPPAWEAIRSATEVTVAWIRENVVPVVQRVAADVVAAFHSVVAWTEENWPKISEAVGHVMVVIRDVVGAVLAAIWFVWSNTHNQIMAVVTTVWAAIQLAVETAITIVRNIIELVLNVINGDWSSAWDNIKAILGAAWDFIIGVIGFALSIVGSIISGALSLISALWSSAWDGIKAFLSAAWNAMTGAVWWALTGIIGFMTALPGNILSAVGNLLGLLGQKGWDLITGLAGGILGAFSGVAGWFGNIGNWVIGAIGNIAQVLGNKGRDLIQGLWDGIKDKFASLTSWLSDAASSLADTVSSALSIFSPSRVFMRLGGHIGDGLRIGIEDSMAGVHRAVSNLVAVPSLGSASVTVAPFAASGVRHEVVHRHEVDVRFSDLKLTGTPQDHQELARQLARPVRQELIRIAPSVGGLWGSAA